MQDQSCHVPSAAGQMAKSTGCCPAVVKAGPRSGSPAMGQQAPNVGIEGLASGAPPAPVELVVVVVAVVLAAVVVAAVAPAPPALDELVAVALGAASHPKRKAAPTRIASTRSSMP